MIKIQNKNKLQKILINTKLDLFQKKKLADPKLLKGTLKIYIYINKITFL